MEIKTQCKYQDIKIFVYLNSLLAQQVRNSFELTRMAETESHRVIRGKISPTLHINLK